MEDVPLAVIGTDQAGLATAWAANRRGLRPLALEAADRPGGSWPHYYDSLPLYPPPLLLGRPARSRPGRDARHVVRRLLGRSR
ncbi:NAD(P)-binding protein [Nocardiopsis synnemataformans]|uniref:NAD(P)-binding protein n=1 Tax=Nocardiopsis synnemataformans TaxID=61305 RepID=UPI003EB6B0A4